jgi:tRNA A-37 threonylcarbamoyl transferase component Bud32/TolB-like protein
MDEVRDRLERSLAATYDFQRELGGGGMSRTYLAVERALNRRVVVKVLAPELLAGISVERFRREVLLAAQLQHPHVVPVLSAGDVDGLPWFSMPYVDGDSLRHRLGRGPLPMGEVLSVLRDVARALAYAHAQGIVHRDIKPDNVLLSSGSATVTDFGIAKAISAARTDGGSGPETLTQVGTSIGTPTYMAPEQAAADPTTDHRADIYAFGAMAYELITGQPPFVASSPTRLLAAHMGETPKDPRVHRPDTPAPLAELVLACLAKNPDERPQHATDLVRVLDTVASSGSGAAAPAVLHGGRIRLGRALAIWAVATAVVALTAWAATDVIGLPEWVFPGSLGVMIAGLPAILGTAYVQRTALRAYTATPRHTPGGTAAVTHGTMATLALKASPHVSWRRTWLGGSVAVGAFAVLVIGFMVTRALGIGPAASLRGTGAFGDRETIVVADFRSPAGDSTLGGTVSEALRTDLTQSSSLNVLTRPAIRQILGLMERATESNISFDLAREIATREGAKAVLDGDIVRLGQNYLISSRLVSALDGTELANFRETARNADDLLNALGKMSRAVREKAGESLRTIRASSSLERVTTPSLPALRKYVEGSIAADEQGETDRGIALLREAVTLDTSFAMAWRKLGVLLANEGIDRQQALDAMTNAFRQRAHLTEGERLLTEGYYYTNGPEADEDKALAAYEDAIQLDSSSTSALNNAGVIYGRQNDHVRAEAAYRRVITLPRSFAGAFLNLLREQVRLGKTTALDSTVAALRARYPTSVAIGEAEWIAAWGHGDLDRADSIGRAVYAASRPRQQVRAAFGVALVAELRGQPKLALKWAALSTDATQKASPSAANRFQAAFDTAYYNAITGKAAEARAALARGFVRDPLDSMPATERPWDQVSEIAALTGDAALARQALQGFNRDLAPTARDSAARRAYFAARVALSEQRWDEAIALLHRSGARHGLPERYAMVQLARAHELAGRPDSAIAYYEKFLGSADATDWTDPHWRPLAYEWLGELYAARGENRKAIEQFSRLVELWSKAEPELQPRVKQVQGRLAALRAQVG